MKKIVLLILFSQVVVTFNHAQGKWEKNFYSSVNSKNFHQFKIFNDTIDFNNIDFPRLQAAIFYLTNEERIKNKLPELNYSDLLEKTALMHSEDMVKYEFFGHENTIDKNKKDQNMRARITGIQNPYVAENIAETFGIQYKANTRVFTPAIGQFSYSQDGNLIPPHTYLSLAEVFLNMWMNSPEHKKNILSRNAIQLGCGIAFYYNEKFNSIPTFIATQNFQWYEPVNK
ncbi:MAG: CAP domain-containing protein [Bacteroidales bacterium]|nr:CAP domain-containing protein [Bacteroidales bacterium]